MNPRERLLNDLETTGTGKIKEFGNSMLPILKSGSLMTYIKQDDYDVGDVVFCKVKGSYFTHIVKAKNPRKGFLIGNNHGKINGWTHSVFAKAISSEHNGEKKSI